MASESKLVYFEPAGRIHSVQRELISYPPDGYQFAVPRNLTADRIFSIKEVHARARQPIGSIVPSNLIAGMFRSVVRPSNPARLIYSYNHIPSPSKGTACVIFVEWFHVLAGRNIRQFRLYRGIIQKFLESKTCRSIVTWCEPARQAILSNFARSLDAKTFTVPLSVHPKNALRNEETEKVRILFVGSLDTEGDFYLKGGHEALEAFKRISPPSGNVEFVVRASVPNAIAAMYKDVPGLRIIGNPLSRVELDSLYRSSDIFVQPTHDTPFGAFLEAMSFGLPVVTADRAVNSQIVVDGVNGLLLPTGDKTSYFLDSYCGLSQVPVGATPMRNYFLSSIAKADETLVQSLARGLTTLVSDGNLRRKLGESGRYETEFGKFSMQRRNSILKTIFDGAVSRQETTSEAASPKEKESRRF